MKIFKLCTKKTSKAGKNSWPEIGVLFSNDQGQLSGYLNNNPDVQVYLFEQKPKQHPGSGQQQQQPPVQFADNQGGLNPADFNDGDTVNMDAPF